jgi:hypothetical protein
VLLCHHLAWRNLSFALRSALTIACIALAQRRSNFGEDPCVHGRSSLGSHFFALMVDPDSSYI